MHLSLPRIRPFLVLLATFALLAVGLAAGLAAGSLAVADGRGRPVAPAPAPDTMVLVLGDAANGFRIKRYDGSWLHLPTDSEAFAECGEYGRRIDRVRCRVEVRTWYRDLGDLKKTIRYYRSFHPRFAMMGR